MHILNIAYKYNTNKSKNLNIYKYKTIKSMNLKFFFCRDKPAQFLLQTPQRSSLHVTSASTAATAASATTAATADDSSNLQLAPLHPKPRTRVSREFDLVLKLKSPNGVVEVAMRQV